MGNSIKLFSVRGIAIRMHITFPLILIWAALQFGLLAGRGSSGALVGVIVTLLLFAIVILHELGHGVAAQQYGVTVRQIVLLPIGGVAQLARIPEKPVQEFVIAIAGPLVNFGLAILLALVAVVFGLTIDLGRLTTLFPQLGTLNAASLFRYLFASNLFLGVFNLLPAFPMDGGRVLRAALATRMPYARATSTAVTIGQSLAWLLGLWGFLQGNFFLILIAVFIYMGAAQEGQSVQLRSVLRGLTVEQAYARGAQSLSPQSTLRDAVGMTLHTFQADFPICDGDQLVGLLTHNRLVEGIDKFGPDALVTRVMLSDIEPIYPQDSLIEAQSRLSDGRLDALPVVENDCFVGLITSRDIIDIYRLLSSRADLLPAAAAQST